VLYLILNGMGSTLRWTIEPFEKLPHCFAIAKDSPKFGVA